jgi:hypothetical protein
VSAQGASATPAFGTTDFIDTGIANPFRFVNRVYDDQGKWKETGRSADDWGASSSHVLTRKGQIPETLGGQAVVYVWGSVKYRDIDQRCQADFFTLKTEGPLKPGVNPLMIMLNGSTDAAEYHKCENGKFATPYPR